MQKRETCGNAKRSGSQIDVGATRIVKSVSEEQQGMENKGGTEWESLLDERSELDKRRTRFDKREEDEKLREVKGEFVTKREGERERERERGRTWWIKESVRFLAKGERVRGSQLPPHSYTHDPRRRSDLSRPRTLEW
ncbi:hypothetical protein ALC56_09342 [Trachymyrmex septentrionalis]|uniref:Uncharacterized protein n=1 Tax=Trachymyrmex septentrionalis TaxID=34720 RepID=A0A195F867_9HYME|nr:hypothetical protein ALC56_09342 [Trachymyrmex septentrionalis]